MRSKWRDKLSVIDMWDAVRRGENNRRRLSPTSWYCEGWAKEMVEKLDVDGDLVGLDNFGLRIGN